MTLTDWITETEERIRNEGVAGLSQSGKELYLGALRRLNWFYPDGTNVFEKEWDLLVILDTCRVDVMREVSDDYEFVRNVSSVRFVGSSSPEWLSNTFVQEHAKTISQTAYVSGNVHTERLIDESELYALDEVWRDAWDDELRTVDADTVTDHTISMGRNTRSTQMIVHYMQLYFSYIRYPELNRRSDDQTRPDMWEDLRRGNLSRDEVWEAYIDNLRHVLDEVAVLLENVTAEKVVLTADHGEAFGERGVHEHPDGMPLSVLREVPWCVTEARDKRTRIPENSPRTNTPSTEEKLCALGYR